MTQITYFRRPTAVVRRMHTTLSMRRAQTATIQRKTRAVDMVLKRFKLTKPKVKLSKITGIISRVMQATFQ